MNRKTSILVSTGISVALLAFGIWFLYNHHYSFGFGGRHWMMPHRMMMGGGGMGLIMILFWIVLLLAVVLLVSGLLASRRSSIGSGLDSLSDPLEILKRRYASGEIDKDQYDAMRKDLQ